ncbi:MAG: TRAP transporter large permease subunit [Neisseriaceae bacterium]|nr:MAG: TRAP transporter large permease subunit [Neisseriaceae bacterium]
MDWHFFVHLSSLLVIVLYTIMVFRNVDPLVATAIGVVLGFLFNLSSPIEIGKTMEAALGSFMALVGLIIMLGRGLGEILTETKVSHTMVHKIVYSIGVNTQRRVKIGIITSSVVIVAVLGTLAGGLAILAPILRPIAGSVKLSRPSMAVLMQAAGEEALILGPFAPPVVALLGVTGISYGSMLLYASIPIALVTIVVTWVMASRLQVQYAHETFPHDATEERFVPTLRQNTATIVFILAFIACVAYGLIFQAKTSYVIFVMLFLSLLTGIVGGLRIGKVFQLLVEGMKKNFHLFFIFFLLGPMLDLVQKAGGFDALMKLFIPLEHFGGKIVLSILIGITGAFGMPAASAAVIKMLHEMFSPVALEMNLNIITFAFSMLLATRITNFAIPGANMFAAMGFAESQNVKAMIKNGLTVTAVQILFLVVYSVIWH